MPKWNWTMKGEAKLPIHFSGTPTPLDFNYKNFVFTFGLLISTIQSLWQQEEDFQVS